MTAEVFAPGVISTGAIEASLTFSYDHRFMVFRRGFRQDTEIFLSENKAGTWTKPVRAPFFVKEYGFGDFTFSPNEPVLYFTSRRPLESGQPSTESSNLWRVEYDNGQWRSPSPIANVLITPLHESYPSVAKDKTLYFFRRFDDENGNYEMMYSELTTVPIQHRSEWEKKLTRSGRSGTPASPRMGRSLFSARRNRRGLDRMISTCHSGQQTAMDERSQPRRRDQLGRFREPPVHHIGWKIPILQQGF